MMCTTNVIGQVRERDWSRAFFKLEVAVKSLSRTIDSLTFFERIVRHLAEVLSIHEFPSLDF